MLWLLSSCNVIIHSARFNLHTTVNALENVTNSLGWTSHALQVIAFHNQDTIKNSNICMNMLEEEGFELYFLTYKMPVAYIFHFNCKL